MNKSIVKDCGSVSFPEFQCQRVYMREYRKGDKLPSDLIRWKNTIDTMLEPVNTDNQIFITIDEKKVLSGKTHRRPAPHIDGYWMSGYHSAHVHTSGGHGYWGTNGVLDVPEAIILASSEVGSRGFIGDWDSKIGEGGDMSHHDFSNMEEIVLKPNRFYIGNVGFIHESTPVEKTVNRSLVRLVVKNWEL